MHQTLLPMPPGIHNIYEVELTCRESGGEAVDLYLKAAIEGIIIKWATQINEILKENSRIAFAEGAHPTPTKEVEFWKDRLKNLESVYDQMRDPRVKKMASYLGKIVKYLSVFVIICIKYVSRINKKYISSVYENTVSERCRCCN